MNPQIKKLEDDLTALGEGKAQSTVRVDLLNELVLEVGWDDPERAAALATEAYEISRKISYEKHGGEIAVESELGKGTTFRTTLPVKLTPENRKS